jgi:ubiquinone/menaquinone biosynthesis C-methylase UbiE
VHAHYDSLCQPTESVETDIHDCAAFEDDSVSHMLCGFVIFLVPNPAKAIGAIKRVMAPGGVVAISALQSSDWGKLSMYPIKVRPDLEMTIPTNGCTSAEEITTHLADSGSKDVEAVQIENYMAFDDYDAVCRFVLTKLPMAARAIRQMTNEEVVKTHELMMADLKIWYPQLPAKMIGKVNVAYCRN